MSNHCHGSSCHTGGESASDHCHEKHCSQCKCNCACHSQSCCKEDECKDHLHELLELADLAWEELMLDKLKKRIESSEHGKKMDEMVTIISEVNHARWKNKMDKQKNCEEYERRMKELCHTCDQEGKQHSNKEGQYSSQQPSSGTIYQPGGNQTGKNGSSSSYSQ